MTSQHNNGHGGADGDQERRYAELDISDEELAIYDRENYDAWIQSDTTLDVEAVR